MEVPTLSGIRDKLADMAASDAHHDFDKHRQGKLAHAVFSYMFNGYDNNHKVHKGIGTPKEPTQVITEYDTLNMFLNFSLEREGSDRSDLIKRSDFIKKYIKDDYVTRDVPRATDDPIPYEVQSFKISTHANHKNTYILSPSKFIDRLAPSGRDVAFCIDTDSIGFTGLFNETDPGVVKRTAYFVYPREFINDESPITRMEGTQTTTEGGNYSVQVHCLYDKYPSPITYNSTDLDEDPKPTFYSKFNVSITTPRDDTIQKADIIYTKDSGEVVKAIEIDTVTRQNSVNNLTTSIYEFFTNKRTDYDQYYVMLQRKRSGDWLQVLSCLHTERYPELSGKNIPIILVTGDTICAAYAIATGVDVLYTKHVYTNPDDKSVGDNWVIYFRKKVNGDGVSEEERFAKIVAQLPKPDAKLPYLMNSSYLEVRDVFVQYRRELGERLFAELSPIVASLTAAEDMGKIERYLKLFLKKYAQIVLMRIFLEHFPVKKRGEEALNNLANASIYETNLSILKRFFKGKEGDMPAAIKKELDKNTIIKVKNEFNVLIKDISITGRYNIINVRVRAQSLALLTKFKEYLTEEERIEFLRVVTILSTKLQGDDLKSYLSFFDTTKFFVGMEGNGPKVHNWLLATAIVEGILEEPAAEAEEPAASGPAPEAPGPAPEAPGPVADAPEAPAPVADAPEAPAPEAEPPEASGPVVEVPEASGPVAEVPEPDHPEEDDEDASESRYELSSTYGPSVLLALRFQNKREKNHRIDDLDGRRHSAMTTPILFMYKLVIAMQQVQDQQASDPDYSTYNEYMLQYISQWLSKILRALPGTNTKKEYKDVECFLLGMIFQYESDMKNSAEYIEFLESFLRDMYGISLTEYLIRECPHIAMEPFVFREGVPYSALIDDLKGLIRITLNKLRSYEEDPRRLVELHEKAARVAAAERAAEEADRAAAYAEAADAVARAAVLARAEEEIATRAALKAAAGREAALAEDANRIHKMAEKARFHVGVAQRGVRKAVALASKRGIKHSKAQSTRQSRLVNTTRKKAYYSDYFTAVTRRKVHPA